MLVTLLGFGLFRFLDAVNVNFVDTQVVVPVMFYSFLGAYTFSVYYLYRRYVTLDLQPPVYLYITVRMFTVQAIALILAQWLSLYPESRVAAMVPIVAFVIGYLPDVGIRWFISLAGQVITRMRKHDKKYLSVIEGISLWHETRLRESGIDNVQNLAAANVQELLLNSRFSAQELMHWIDQAILRINISDKKLKVLNEYGLHTISGLRLFLEKSDALKDSELQKLGQVTVEELQVVGYASETSPNLSYVSHYWRAMQTYHKEMVNRSLADLLQEEFQAGTDLANVPDERLAQVLDAYNLTLKEAEEMFFDEPDSLVGLSRVYIRRGQPEEAIRILDEVLEKDKHHAAAYSVRGWARFVLGSEQEQQRLHALEDFDESIKLNKGKEGRRARNAVNFNRKGTVFRATGQAEDIEKAEGAYSEAIRLNPRFASAYYNRGKLNYDLGNYKKALDDFNQAVRYNPGRIDAYLKRGEIFLNEQDDFDEALHNFNQVVRCNRNNPEGYYRRAKAYLKAGDYQQVLYDLNTAIDIDPAKSDYYFERAGVWFELGDIEGAIADLTSALRLNIKLVDAYELRAKLYEGQGNLKWAVRDLQLYLDP
ncbi:MAG: tetratricopeptide repeat protein [Aestuariibacter sp.]|nr:tetratricopeptide repeat protein [Aestuariibacter sp.]